MRMAMVSVAAMIWAGVAFAQEAPPPSTAQDAVETAKDDPVLAPAPPEAPPPPDLIAPPRNTSPLIRTVPRYTPPAPEPTMRVEASSDGKTVYLVGQLTRGSFQRVKKVLDANRNAKLLWLHSPGGIVIEGAAIGKLVRDRGLNTYAEHHCASACTAILAAGADRAIAPGARIGFHRSHSILQPYGSDDTPAAEFADTMFRQAYARSGIAQPFVTRALAVPGTDMWFPADAELVAAKVATRLARPGEVALPDGFAPDRAGVAGKLGADAFWKAAKLADLALAEQALDAAWTDLVLKKDAKRAETAAFNYLGMRLTDRIRIAPDAVLGEVVTAMAKHDEGKPPLYRGYCTSNVGIGSRSFSMRTVAISREEEKALLALMAAKPATVAMTERDAVERTAAFMVDATASGAFGSDPARSFEMYQCQTAAIYGAIAALPLAERAPTLRAIAIYDEYERKSRAKRGAFSPFAVR